MPATVEATPSNTKGPGNSKDENTLAGPNNVPGAELNPEPLEYDDFGLLVRKPPPTTAFVAEDDEEEGNHKDIEEEDGEIADKKDKDGKLVHEQDQKPTRSESSSDSENEEFKDADETPIHTLEHDNLPVNSASEISDLTNGVQREKIVEEGVGVEKEGHNAANPSKKADKHTPCPPDQADHSTTEARTDEEETNNVPKQDAKPEREKDGISSEVKPDEVKGHHRGQSLKEAGISEWSHQHALIPDSEKAKEEEEDGWQEMPSIAPYDIYDDNNKLIAREARESDDEADVYASLGGAGKGYTRVQLDEDAQSATSMDDNTQYLFKEAKGTGTGEFEDEEQRDAVAQMQATKNLLTEGQRIAYIGMTRIILTQMLKSMEQVAGQKPPKDVVVAKESLKMWSQKMMVRLYAHMEISAAEQVMIEQLSEHGVVPSDLTPTLMQNARVKNPMASDAPSDSESHKSTRDSLASPKILDGSFEQNEESVPPPPPYEDHEGDELPEVRTPSQLPTTTNIDIDLRWTVLCDLFLTLIADSVYDGRSRVLLEKVGESLSVSWLEICKFEKRVTDALEMQQAAEKENWNEDEHKENRRKLALKKRYMMMGLATVGGGLVIGLSAGLLAPVIGAGLAAGFTTIGVAGTSSFLAGAGGAAIITTSAAASGSIIGVRAANRRTGAVKTFEYRPLHNNKRVNLIVTVSGWMTGKVDDVRLPYSTVDPIMGDIYSVLWEPEMLTSMGDTINILATEALTQGLQQVLGSTILIGLMAALQLPVVLTKLAYLIDNPWTVSLDRANSAGLILADSLIDRNLGTRPITFVGYSLGSRLIFSCLKELSKKGAYGLVQNVYLFGSPIVANKDEYLKARSVVAGRFVNGYATNDWILGYLFRLTSGGISRVAGLAPIEDIPGLENIDVTELVPGHMAYRTAMPRLLREVGWEVESDEFTEIEDPDPDNLQQKRQRELINEIEEARKGLEKKEKESKGGFGFFGKKKKSAVQPKEWETYDDFKKQPLGRKIEDGEGNNHGVLFDIDAIRAELASEQMEVKELQSTLPPMKLDLGSPGSTSGAVPNRRSTTSGHSKSTGQKPNGLGVESLGMELPSQPRHSYSFSHSSSNNLTYEPSPPLNMSFETAYQAPSRSRSSSTNNLSMHSHTPSRPHSRSPSRTLSPNLGRDGSGAFSSPSASPRPRSATRGGQPDFTSSVSSLTSNSRSKTFSQTPSAPLHVPAITLDHMHMSRNAWADDDDEFGQEQEIEMTFA